MTTARSLSRAPEPNTTDADRTRELERALRDLREREAQYRGIIEATNQGVWTVDANGWTTFMNPQLVAMLGYELGETLGMSIFDFLPDGDREAAKMRFAERRRGVGASVEVRLKRKDGSLFWSTSMAAPVIDDAGEFHGTVTMVSNTDERRKADEERQRLAVIIETSQDAIMSSRPDGTITSWNHAAEKLFGYRVDEALKGNVAQLLPPDRLGEFVESVARLQRGEPMLSFESTRRCKDGASAEVALSLRLITNADGEREVCCIARDIGAERRATEMLRRTEDQLRQSQKMEAIGRLAGGIAHDFNNLLSVILSYAQIVAADLAPNDPVREDVGEIGRAAQRAAELTRQLLTFSRQQLVSPKSVDLNEVLLGLDKMLKRIVGEDIWFTSVYAKDLRLVFADPSNIEQAIMNLVVNARDAMPTGGRLTIETANVELDEEYARAHVGAKPGPHAMLAVTDTGVGMDKATLARIFEPFFTTKEKSKGTGLGLSTTFGIVHQFGGSIWVYSEVGQGTTFKLYFPRLHDDGKAKADRGAIDRPKAERGSETILLVEDEAQVRNVAQGILRRVGYNVIAAPNAGEALLASDAHAGKIDLLLTDVVMPQMSGAELAARLTTLRPGLKVLCMSGYTDDSVIRHGVLESGVEFLQKPFTPDTLARKVRAVLDSGKSARL